MKTTAIQIPRSFALPLFAPSLSPSPSLPVNIIITNLNYSKNGTIHKIHGA